MGTIRLLPSGRFNAQVRVAGFKPLSRTHESYAAFLKGKPLSDLKPEMIKVRHRVYNPSKATFFGITFDSTFTAVH